MTVVQEGFHLGLSSATATTSDRSRTTLRNPLLVTFRQQLLSVLLDLIVHTRGKASLRAARAFFYWVMDNELIDRNPCQRLRIGRPSH